MEKHGWNVEKHFHLETAWVATFSHGNASGGRVLGVNSEMDALPGIGHACGHNLIAIAGVAVSLAIKAALIEHDIPGKVILLGTPGMILYIFKFEGMICKTSTAEEGGEGKVVLLEKGAYREMDACLMWAGIPTRTCSNLTVHDAGVILLPVRSMAQALAARSLYNDSLWSIVVIRM
jgi:metal-dependent amidase/aminoacylase/carboxypeptidase family protein